jgi:hypothetical protein
LAVVVSPWVLLLALYACGSDTGANPQDSEPEVAGQVDAGGATLSAQSGKVSLTMPPGAVPAATTITVQPVAGEPTEPNLVPGTLFEFGPDGLQFEEPVTLRLAYDPTAIPEQADEAQLRIFKRSGTSWLPTDNGSVDIASATVSGEIDSFSQYAVVSFGKLAVATTSLVAGVEQVPYEDFGQLTATGGDSVYLWTVASGALPAGLILLSNGDIFGTPSVVGTETATFEVESGDGQSAQQVLSITVSARPILLPTELCTDFPGYAVATFADINVEVAAKASLGLGPADALSCLDASGVQYLSTSPDLLSANPRFVTSLVGIQNFPNLLEIHLERNSLSDISPIGTSDLPRLRAITLTSNSVTDIGALSGIARLDFLALGNNSITNIDALTGLTGLTRLWLDDNSITDVGPLVGLTSLTTLDLSNNSITDITALGGLSSATVVDLSDNSITIVSALSGLTALESLNLNNNSIFSIQALGSLSSLRTLDVDDNRIGSLNWNANGSGLTSLTHLSLERNTMTGMPFDTTGTIIYGSPLGGLSSVPNLEYLSLAGTPVGTFEPVLDFQPLIINRWIGEGDQINLFGTLVSCSVLPDVEAKGANVTWPERC